MLLLPQLQQNVSCCTLSNARLALPAGQEMLFAPTVVEWQSGRVDAPQFELQIVQGSICIRAVHLGQWVPGRTSSLPALPARPASPTKLLPEPASLLPLSRVDWVRPRSS